MAVASNLVLMLGKDFWACEESNHDDGCLACPSFRRRSTSGMQGDARGEGRGGL